MLADGSGPLAPSATLTATPDEAAPAPPRAQPATVLNRARAIEQEEHAGNSLRLRTATTLGACVWPFYFVVDWLVDRHVQPGLFRSFALLRFACWLVLIAGALRLWRPRLPSPRELLALDTTFFGLAAAAVSMMCLPFGGLRSPYAAGIPVILFCRAAFLAMPWRTALIPNLTSALMYPLILLGSAAFGAAPVAAQVADPAALVLFVLYLCLIFSSVAFAVVGGHSVWRLRRQLFEARSVGRYRLLRCIGRGGVGEVWSAHHPGLKRNVAVKVLRSQHCQDPMAMLRFEREVKATSELTHPNTVRIFDYGMTGDGVLFYAMELLDGVDLARLVREQGPLPVGRALHIISQASRALAEAHGRGIVHRDVKPQNLFVTTAGGESDFIKVLDFGIARLADEDGDQTLTRTGWIGGTPAYISPEVAAGKRADGRSDVYALGAVLYFLLTGEPPFVADGAAGLLAAHLQSPARAPSERSPSPVPAQLDSLVLRCLAKDAQARFADAGELAEALAALSRSQRGGQ